AAQQRHSRLVERIDRHRVVKNLRRGVSVGGVQKPARSNFPLESNLGAVGKSLIDVNVFAHEGHRVHGNVVDLIAKQIVEVSRGENVTVVEQVLQESSLEGAIAFRLQRSIRNTIRRSSESLFQPRLL